MSDEIIPSKAQLPNSGAPARIDINGGQNSRAVSYCLRFTGTYLQPILKDIGSSDLWQASRK